MNSERKLQLTTKHTLQFYLIQVCYLVLDLEIKETSTHQIEQKSKVSM